MWCLWTSCFNQTTHRRKLAIFVTWTLPVLVSSSVSHFRSGHGFLPDFVSSWMKTFQGEDMSLSGTQISLKSQMVIYYQFSLWKRSLDFIAVERCDDCGCTKVGLHTDNQLVQHEQCAQLTYVLLINWPLESTAPRVWSGPSVRAYPPLRFQPGVLQCICC